MKPELCEKWQGGDIYCFLLPSILLKSKFGQFQVDHLRGELCEEKEKFEREKREMELAKDQERDSAVTTLTPASKEK